MKTIELVANGDLRLSAVKFDTGLAGVIELPAAKTGDRWHQTTPP